MLFFFLACSQGSQESLSQSKKSASESQKTPIADEQPNKEIRVCDAQNAPKITAQSGFDMRLIPAGEFTMGHQNTNDRHEDEEPYLVRISRPFYLAETELTQSVWTHMTGKNPTPADNCGDSCPVKMVTWCDAVQFANLLSAIDGLAPAYQLPKGFQIGLSSDRCNQLSQQVRLDLSSYGYRLPTEAEWEYAARGLRKTHYPGSDDPSEVGWWEQNSDGRLHPVALKKANGYGLYDMLGNVWEWCFDYHSIYPTDLQIDPTGPTSGHSRTYRGGAYDFGRGGGRLANRNRSSPETKGQSIGFRLAKTAKCND